MTAQRAALAAFCADHDVKLVHVWQGRDHWSAMAEYPAKKPERHATGVADDPCTAVIAVLDRLGHKQLAIRLFVVAYILGIR